MGAGGSVPAGTPFDEISFKFTSLRGGGEKLFQIAAIRLYTEDGKEFVPKSVSNPGGNSPRGEGVWNLMDSANLKKKFLNMAHGRSGHTTVNFVLGETVCIAFYELFTANDWESRDPVSWSISARRNEGAWVEGSKVADFAVPGQRFTGTGRLPVGAVDEKADAANAAALAEEMAAETKRKNAELMAMAKPIAKLFGKARPKVLPTPKLLPDWFYDIQQAFYDIENDRIPDVPFPLVTKEFGALHCKHFYESVFRNAKIVQDEGLTKSQSLFTDKSSFVGSVGINPNPNLLNYRNYFGALHPSYIGKEPGDIMAFLNRTVLINDDMTPNSNESCSTGSHVEFVVDLGETRLACEGGYLYTPWDRDYCSQMEIYGGETQDNMKKLGGKSIPKDAAAHLVDRVKSEYGYDLSGKASEVLGPLFLDSKLVYTSALNTIRKSTPKALEALEMMKEKIPNEAPIQPTNDPDKLWKEAEMAQKKIKEAIAPGTIWAETIHDAEWAEKQKEAGKKVNLERTIAAASEGVAAVIEKDEAQGLLAWVKTGMKAYDPHVKGRRRGMEKAEYKYRKPNGDVNYKRLRDLSRIALQFETIKESMDVIKVLETKFEVLQFENRWQHPTPLGWRDLSLLLKVDLPEVESFHIVEVQIHIFLFTKARKKAHAQYEKIRSMLPKLCPGCPPKELNRVQYLILDSLKTAVNRDRGDPMTEHLNSVTVKFNPTKLRYVKYVFEGCHRGGPYGGQRFSFLHMRGPVNEADEKEYVFV